MFSNLGLVLPSGSGQSGPPKTLPTRDRGLEQTDKLMSSNTKDLFPSGILSKSNLGQAPNGQITEHLQTVRVIEKACPCCKLWKKKNGDPHFNGKDQNRPFHCDFCSKSFRQEAHLKAHVRLHTHKDERPFSCETCGKNFRGQTSYKLHRMIHDGQKQFVCNICNKSFRQKTHLKSHYLIHTREKPYVCYVCNKGFGLSSRLKTHLRVHTKERPYNSKIDEQHRYYGEKETNRPFNCEVCNKAFRLEAHLKKHQQVHANEKPYPCHVCSKRLSSSDTLKKHLRIHSGEKPFSCEVCGKCFRQKAHVERHMKSHNKAPVYSVQQIQGVNHQMPTSSKEEHYQGKHDHQMLGSASGTALHSQTTLHIPIPHLQRP